MKLSPTQKKFCLRMAVANALSETCHAPSQYLQTRVAHALVKRGILTQVSPFSFEFTSYGRQFVRGLLPKTEVTR
ncbi:MAG: hypothetical protein HC847_13115 [Hydrococcus sp. RU_2_2]|nr:hypothetical protein [Hydrococcus sp. RU_2_2]